MIDMRTLNAIIALSEISDKLNEPGEFKAQLAQLKKHVADGRQQLKAANEANAAAQAALAETETRTKDLDKREAAVTKKEDKVTKDADDIKELRATNKALQKDLEAMQGTLFAEKEKFDKFLASETKRLEKKEAELDAAEQAVNARLVDVEERERALRQYLNV